jgi:hypothetical protein
MEILGRALHVQGRLVRIGRLDGDKYERLTDPEAALAQVRKAPIRVDMLTFMETLPHTTPSHNYPVELDNYAALPISTFEHWLTKQIDFKVRNKVRKAEKAGITVREVPFDDEMVRGIHTIYNEAPMRQGKPFLHRGKNLETVRAMSATFLDRSVFIGAFLKGELIGFVKLVADQDSQQAGLMHILSMQSHRDKAPTNALIAQAVRACASRGIPYLVYSNFSYGKKQRDSLSEFKHHNGFQRIEVPRYYVPLTVVGHAALRLGLHHGLTQHIPESIQTRLRTIRTRWNSWRLHQDQRAT